MPSPQVASSKSTEFTYTQSVCYFYQVCETQFSTSMLKCKDFWFCCVNFSKYSCSAVYFSFYGGSEDLSDDITQQQLLPGVKYEKKILLIKHTKLSISEKTTGLVLRDLSFAGILICGLLSVRLVLSNM